MERIHFIDAPLPLSKCLVVTANCEAEVQNPVAIAALEPGEIQASSSLGPICLRCFKLAADGRHYRYAILNGQEALAERLLTS